MILDLALASALLFVPGDRPSRFDKAFAAGPDGVILDLEDAVGPADKDAARRAVVTYLRDAPQSSSAFVRLNPLATRHGLADLCAVSDGDLAPEGVVIAKVESAQDVRTVRAHLPERCCVIATIESAAGLAAAPSIARSLVPGDALGFGGADLAADLGSSFDWEPLLLARTQLVQAAAANRLALIDVPFLDTVDDDGLRAEASRARALGFTGKFAIHPRQVPTILSAFTPTEAEVASARRISAAAGPTGRGAIELDGRMIDAPVVSAARRILERSAARGRPVIPDNSSRSIDEVAR